MSKVIYLTSVMNLDIFELVAWLLATQWDCYSTTANKRGVLGEVSFTQIINSVSFMRNMPQISPPTKLNS